LRKKKEHDYLFFFLVMARPKGVTIQKNRHFQKNSPGSPRCQWQLVMTAGLNRVIYFA
jgi:hypothetical protein